MSSDFIIGFPGETEHDFAATMQLVEDVGFDQSFSFIYSRRPGTPAAGLAGRRAARREATAPRSSCSSASTLTRARSASEWSAQCSASWSNGRRKKNPLQLAGRTENNRWVNFDGPASLLDQFVDVAITEALKNSLRGRLVAASADYAGEALLASG